MRDMKLPSSLAIATATLLLAGAAACGDSTGPAVPTGTFTLRSIDGQPLPALVAEERLRYEATGSMAAVRTYTDAMALVIAASDLDTLRVRGRVDWEPDAGDNPAPVDIVSGATVDARADRLCIRIEIPGQSACAGPTWVRRTRDEIVVRLSPGIYPSSDGEYRFVREGR